MKVEQKENTKLIDELKINDSKRAIEFDKTPEEPRVALEELVKLAEKAVEPLIELLQDRSKYSCLYAIRILGEIGDIRAVEPILGVLASEEFNNNFQSTDEHDQPIIALHTIGLPSLEPTLQFLKTEIEKGNEFRISDALEILAGINDEKSFSALVEMLFHDDPRYETEVVRETAVELLGKYGDTRAVEHLAKLLDDEGAREDAAQSIRRLISVKEYREIIDPYASKYLNSQREEISAALRDLQYAHEYSYEFEGDDADELNFLAQEFRIGTNMEKLLSSATKIAAFEHLTSEKDEERLEAITWGMDRKRWKLEEKHEEEKTIIDGYIPGPVHKKETKSYKGIAPESFGDDHPRLSILRSSIVDWLKNQGFRVVKKDNHMYARKGSKKAREGCYIHVGKDEDGHRRTWGKVVLMIWGEGWTTEETDSFAESIWQHIHAQIENLVSNKKVQIQILETQTS